MAATLTFQGSTIHSLKDLRENIEKEACLKALMDHTLCQWLSEHYYETEAMQIRSLCMEDPNCYSKLCEILSVPYEENPNFSEEEKENLAKTAVENNGYDNYALSHSPLASRLHQELKAGNLYLRYNLPNDASLAGKFFTKKSECETAKKAALQNAYTKAQAYLTPGHSKCMAKEAAEHYSQKIESSFVPFIDSLKTFCSLSERNSVFDKLSGLISHSKKNLKARFEEELNEHSDYYKLYGLEYFMEQAEIEEHDFRISDEGFFKFLETVLADNIQYTLNNIYSVILELENDLNKYAGTFSRSALTEYQRYVEEIEKLVDSLGKGLPEFIENEDINDYLRRMCITLVK